MISFAEKMKDYLHATQLEAARKRKKSVESASGIEGTIQEDLQGIMNFILTDVVKPNEHRKAKKPGARLTKKETRLLGYENPIFAPYNDSLETDLTTTAAAALRILPQELLDPDTYAFSKIFRVPRLAYRESYLPDVEFHPNITDSLRAKLQKVVAKGTGNSVVLYKGKVVDFVFHYIEFSATSATSYGQIGVRANLESFDLALNELGLQGTAAAKAVASAYNHALQGKPFPSFFAQGVNFKKPFKAGVYMMRNTPVFVPDVNAPEFRARTGALGKYLREDGNIVPNAILGSDSSTNTLVFTDERGRLTSNSLTGLAPISTKMKLNILDKDAYAFFTGRDSDNLCRFLLATGNNACFEASRQLLDVSIGKTIRDVLNTRELRNIVQVYKEYGYKRYESGANLRSWMTFMGYVLAVEDLLTTGKQIIAENEAKVKKFQSSKPEDAPAIPNMREETVHFPHQAEALAKLNVAVDSAIIDIATGGGKAGIIIQDCLNLLNQGLIKRPIVVMPNALVSQFISEIAFFTDNKVNGFALTTRTERSWGREELIAAAKKAPANTIFVTTFSWLSKGDQFTDVDLDNNEVTNFEIPMLLQSELGIDYIAVDESQNIKNMKSNAFKAVTCLGKDVTYKRIATGTLIGNKPTDIVGQLMFLDPTIVGTEKEFGKKYAINGDVKNGYKSDFAENLRARLRSASSYIMYREKDWAPLLPKKVYSFERVSLDNQQMKVYKALVEDVLEEIKNDPVLATAWDAMKNSGEEMDHVPARLLGKLAKLERYLTAPDSAKLMQYADANRVSPKVPAIDRLIAKSLSMPGPLNKVIVATHFKSAAMHLMNNSKYKDVSMYYDASRKDIIPVFQDPKSNVKVLFAVVQSIKEGLNLQVANRIIVADVDWTPGNLMQLEARVFRPHVKFTEKGKVINLNAGKTVYIDTVIADDSADCLKYAFQSYKKVFNSVIMEACPVDIPPFSGISDAGLSAKFTDPIIQGDRIVDTIDQYNKWLQEEIDASLQKGDLELRAVKHARSNIGEDKCSVPWVKGMTLPAQDDEEPLITYLESLGADTEEDDEDESDDDDSIDLKDFKEQLIGIQVRTEKGKGLINGVRRASVSVRYKDGTLSTHHMSVVLHKIGSVPGRNPKGLERALRDKIKENIKADRAAKREVRRAEREAAREAKRAERAARTSRKASEADGEVTEFTKNRALIKQALKDMGVTPRKLKHKVTGKAYCVLAFGDDEMWIDTPSYGSLNWGKWKEFAERLKDGESGMFNADGTPIKGKAPKSPKKAALAPKESKPSRKDKKPTKKTLDLDDEDDTSTDLDDKANDTFDTDDMDDNFGAETTDNIKVKDSDVLDAYLDEDFDFLETDSPAANKGGNKRVKMKTPKEEATAERATRRSRKQADTPKRTRKPAKEESTTAFNPKKLPVRVSSFNNIPSLIALVDEKSGAGLNALKYTWSGPAWLYKVGTAARARIILDMLLNEFSISRESINNIQACLDTFKSGKFATAFPEGGVRPFLLKNMKKARKGTLRVYPMVVGEELFFVVDAVMHPGVSLNRFKFKKIDGYYIYIAPNLASMKKKLASTVTKNGVDSLKTIKKLGADHLRIRL